MMGVSCTSCGHHFAIYVNESITPRALHLHSDVRQLFLNEAGKKTCCVIIQFKCSLQNYVACYLWLQNSEFSVGE